MRKRYAIAVSLSAVALVLGIPYGSRAWHSVAYIHGTSAYSAPPHLDQKHLPSLGRGGLVFHKRWDWLPGPPHVLERSGTYTSLSPFETWLITGLCSECQK